MRSMTFGRLLQARSAKPRIYRPIRRARSLHWNCRTVNREGIMRRPITWLIILALLFGLAAVAQAKHLHPEKYYQAKWCDQQGGLKEVRLSDGTRCDCLTASHAVEVDFARKWHEGIGQALHYARLTGKRAGLVLIIERPRDLKYLDRVMGLIRWHNLELDVWTVDGR